LASVAQVPSNAVLFDLDGTLVDPGVGITNAIAHVVAEMSLPALSNEELRAFVGPPLQDSFASFGLDPGQVAVAVGTYRQYFGERGLYENDVYVGVPNALEALCIEGFKLAVATSKPLVFAERILAHQQLAQYFTVVVGSELDGSRRHKRYVIAECLRQLGEIENVVMVGDRAQDVRGATAHGISCIGVAWGYALEGELADAGAVTVIDEPAQLLQAVTTIIDPE
jgi:phosphoglycolate phosphatase